MKKYLLGASILTALLTIGNQVKANQFILGNAYFGLGAGLAVPSDRSISGTTTGFVGSGKLQSSNGINIAALAGYHFSDYVMGEASISYISYDYNKLSGSVTSPGFGTFTGSVNASGHDNITTGLLNALITPIHSAGISPYFGGGVGISNTSSKVSSINGFSENANESKTSLAWDGIAGADISLNNGLTLGGRYQYLQVNNSGTFNIGAVPTHLGDSNVSVFSLRLTKTF